MKWRSGAVIESRNFYRSDETAKFILPMQKTAVVKRKRTALRIFALLSLASGVVVSAYMLAGTTASSFKEDNLFAIRKVNIFGLTGRNADMVKDSISTLNGKSLLSLSAEDVEKALSGFGFIEGFQLKKQFPSEITVELKQRGAVGVVTYMSRTYELDGKGNYWEVDGLSGRGLELGGNCDLSDKNLHLLAQNINSENLAGTIIYAEPAEPRSFLVKTREGKELMVFSDGLAEEWQKFLGSKEWIEKNLRMRSRIDLRWSNRIVLIPLSVPQGEVEENGKT
jgi:hypothetical protein